MFCKWLRGMPSKHRHNCHCCHCRWFHDHYWCQDHHCCPVSQPSSYSLSSHCTPWRLSSPMHAAPPASIMARVDCQCRRATIFALSPPLSPYCIFGTLAWIPQWGGISKQSQHWDRTSFLWRRQRACSTICCHWRRHHCLCLHCLGVFILVLAVVIVVCNDNNCAPLVSATGSV